MEREEVKRKLEKALSMLREKDEHLLTSDANERSISHKLAVYLEKYFEDWDVDCEYNRDGHNSKRLNLPSKHNVASDDIEARTVFPDIIVHKRGNNEDNLLVIEMKKSISPEEDDKYDRRKLEMFGKELNYRFKVFVKVNVSKNKELIPPEFIE